MPQEFEIDLQEQTKLSYADMAFKNNKPKQINDLTFWQMHFQGLICQMI